MEPVRGGKLASLKPEQEAQLKALRPEESIAAWCFRFLQELPNVKMVLSGMSNMEQMMDNVKTFCTPAPMTKAEMDTILEIAESMKDSIPCTACRYCCDGCPMGLDIPLLLHTFNDLRFAATTNTAMIIEFMEEDKKPSACIGCGACAQVCPQNIDIPGELKNLTEKLKTIPKWAEICKEREAAAKRGRA